MAKTLKRTAAFTALGTRALFGRSRWALGWASGSPRCPG